MRVDILFDGPPGHEAGRFVEVEDADTRKSIKFGSWIERDDGYWVLRVTLPDAARLNTQLDESQKLHVECLELLKDEMAKNKVQQEEIEALRGYASPIIKAMLLGAEMEPRASTAEIHILELTLSQIEQTEAALKGDN